MCHNFLIDPLVRSVCRSLVLADISLEFGYLYRDEHMEMDIAFNIKLTFCQYFDIYLTAPKLVLSGDVILLIC